MELFDSLVCTFHGAYTYQTLPCVRKFDGTNWPVASDPNSAAMIAGLVSVALLSVSKVYLRLLARQ